MKYLLPYEEIVAWTNIVYLRREFGAYGYIYCNNIIFEDDGLWVISFNDKKFINLDDAKNALDKILTNDGYILLSEIDAERFNKKLKTLL